MASQMEQYSICLILHVVLYYVFNYAFNIQLLLNTSTRYSIFNFAFNIQLFILYSIPYSAIQLSIQQFQPLINELNIATFGLPYLSKEMKGKTIRKLTFQSQIISKHV